MALAGCTEWATRSPRASQPLKILLKKEEAQKFRNEWLTKSNASIKSPGEFPGNFSDSFSDQILGVVSNISLLANSLI
jgi:hypothetical protein